MRVINANITCPFCQNRFVKSELGITRCPGCDAGLDIDDRGKCMFADLESLRLPFKGIVCGSCNLIEAGELGIVCIVALGSTQHFNRNYGKEKYSQVGPSGPGNSESQTAVTPDQRLSEG